MTQFSNSNTFPTSFNGVFLRQIPVEIEENLNMVKNLNFNILRITHYDVREIKKHEEEQMDS